MGLLIRKPAFTIYVYQRQFKLQTSMYISNFDNHWLDSITIYCKVPKFSDARKLCHNLPKIETKRPNRKVFRVKDANVIADSEEPDQTAPLGAV